MVSHTVTAMAAPIGTLMKNSQCQENASVSSPPTVGPMVGARVAVRPISTVARTRAAPGNNAKLVAKTVGIIAPPRKPWQARNTTMAPSESATPQASEKSVKLAAETVNSTRVDSRRER